MLPPHTSWNGYQQNLQAINTAEGVEKREPSDTTGACVCFSRVRLFETPWTVARQAPLSMRFSRQECWSGMSCPHPGHLPHPGTERATLGFPSSAGGFFTTNTTSCTFKGAFLPAWSHPASGHERAYETHGRVCLR